MHSQHPQKPQLPSRVPQEPVPPRMALAGTSRLSWLSDWWRSEWMRGRGGRALKIGGAVVGVLLVLLLAVNLVLSADWVEARVAARIKEQTGRDLAVNGSTLLLFTPGPHIVISDAKITDPDTQAGTADLSVAKLKIDLNFTDLFSRRVDAERIVLERPVLTVRLGDDPEALRWGNAKEPRKTIRFAKAQTGGGDERHPRDIRLNDMRIEDGTVIIVYDDETAEEKRIERINARLSLPTVTAPLIGGGTLEWKDQTVQYSFEVTTPADLRAKRPAKLQLALDTKVIAARFDGTLATAPHLAGQGKLAAKASSIPSVLAWMRESPAVSSAIGDGELASDVSWTGGEIALRNIRFALEHASGTGEAVVALKTPRPHLRAALAIDHLDLNPFLEGGPKAKRAAAAPAKSKPAVQKSPEPAGPQAAPRPAPVKDWFSKPAEPAAEVEQVIAPPPQNFAEPAAPKANALAALPSPASVAPPASFDADVNLNVRKTRVGHLDIGPSSLSVGFRDGVMEAALGGMELYDGHASGTVTIDATKPVPSFTGDFRLDGVEAKPLLTDAAQFGMIAGRTKLNLSVSGEGQDAEAIKSSLKGHGAFVVTEGAIEGIDITAFISALGEGDFDLRQGAGAKTGFSDLGGSFVITDGVAETSNLKMVSPLLKVTAEGTVDIPGSTLDILANPEIIAGPEGGGGANNLAGLTVPVRIEGPLDDPRINPQIGSVFANPENASKAVSTIGKALQKKFKGRPVGEAIGRFLGGVQIGGGGAPRKQPQALAPLQDGAAGQGDADDDAMDPELEEILR
jgi:AsmA protein